MTTRTAPSAPSATILLVCRRCLFCATVMLCAVALSVGLTLESYQIPTGSMAPTLLGIHRVCACPDCGHSVAIGRHCDDTTGSGQARYYRKAFCPSCGHAPLDLTTTAEKPGEMVIVNKATYLVRAPQRWEVVVFRLLGVHYIKRLLGLPGEEILIHDGDLYANGKLTRKTYAQAKQMRVLIYDQQHASSAKAGQTRWHFNPPSSQRTGGAIQIDGNLTPTTLTYQNISLDTGKCKPLRDEYGYNAGMHANSECVHDFLIDSDVEVGGGVGTLALRLCDGHDWVEVRLPVGEAKAIETIVWPSAEPEKKSKLADSSTKFNLDARRRYRVEMAFVDRRLSLVVDGRLTLEIDLPEAKQRDSVVSPFQMQAEGVCATLQSFHLYRDTHHGQQGEHGVRGKSVRLGVDHYFVLGDNSPNSDDSRFWSTKTRLRSADLIGPVLSKR